MFALQRVSAYSKQTGGKSTNSDVQGPAPKKKKEKKKKVFFVFPQTYYNLIKLFVYCFLLILGICWKLPPSFKSANKKRLKYTLISTQRGINKKPTKKKKAWNHIDRTKIWTTAKVSQTTSMFWVPWLCCRLKHTQNRDIWEMLAHAVLHFTSLPELQRLEKSTDVSLSVESG